LQQEVICLDRGCCGVVTDDELLDARLPVSVDGVRDLCCGPDDGPVVVTRATD